MSEARGRRVVVVGGGLAGLAAAAELSETGDRVTLLERRGRLGGRTVAFDVKGIGEVGDNGQHMVLRGYDHLYRYLERIGTRSAIEFAARHRVLSPGGGPGWFDLTRPIRTAFTGRLPDLTRRDRLSLLRTGAGVAVGVLRLPPELDTITAAEWLRRLGATPGAMRMMWEPAVIGLFNEPPDRVSAYALAWFARTGLRLRLKTRHPFQLGYPTTDLGSLLVTPAQRLLARNGVDVRTGSGARRLLVRDGRVEAVELADGELVGADAVVVAVGPWDIRKLFEGVPELAGIARDAERLGAAPIVSVNLWLDRPIGTEAPFECLLDVDVEWVFDRTRMFGRRSAAGWLYSLTRSAAWDLNTRTNEEIVKGCLESLRTHYPETRDARVVHAHVVRQPSATFSLRPGTAGARRPQRTPVEGLVLAGDWTRTDFTSTMEGATQSAARAVEALRGYDHAVRRR